MSPVCLYLEPMRAKMDQLETCRGFWPWFEGQGPRGEDLSPREVLTLRVPLPVRVRPASGSIDLFCSRNGTTPESWKGPRRRRRLGWQSTRRITRFSCSRYFSVFKRYFFTLKVFFFQALFQVWRYKVDHVTPRLRGC